MLENFQPVRVKPQTHSFKKGDVLVLFGELFNRGYANGLVEEAEKNGLTIVRATVGRRDENGLLRELNAEEIANIPQPFINVPLEAGFDLEKDSQGMSPVDYLKGAKLSDWNTFSISEKSLAESKQKGRDRFTKNVESFSRKLEQLIADNIQKGSHVHFAHLMAGGVPRTKIVMPLMNRVFKGTDDRYLSSKEFLDSGIGHFVLENFLEVTAHTFDILVQATSELRKKIETNNGTASYVAYGYHGTEAIINGQYRWQSYAPYIQGWAKIALEDHSKKWSKAGVKTCVYNCPEILTNSSSIFQGVEIPLYNLIRALEKEAPTHPLTKKMKEDCLAVLKDGTDLNEIFKWIDDYTAYSEKVGTSKYENWPQHSQKEQLETTLNLSDRILALHKDEKQLMTAVLSEIIFKACGYIMLHDGYKPQAPVAWIGHDIVAKCI